MSVRQDESVVVSVSSVFNITSNSVESKRTAECNGTSVGENESRVEIVSSESRVNIVSTSSFAVRNLADNGDSAIDIDRITDPIPISIIYHDDCALHEVPNHPEQPSRVEFMMNTLRKHYEGQSQGSSNRNMFVDAPVGTRKQILRFHAEEHYDRLMDQCEESKHHYETLMGMVRDPNTKTEGNSFCSKSNQKATKLTKKEARRQRMAQFQESENQKKIINNSIVSIDPDTSVMYATKNAILRAVGGICMAVDMVFQKQSKSVFCCTRPPGHHAERNLSQGFCFLNTVGIGAKHAQAVYGIGKVAILDFDVHHGNGTEEGCWDDPTLFYGSTHEKNNYPGTGHEPEHKGEFAKEAIHRRIVNRTLPSGTESIRAFRTKWREIVEEMIEFEPELIIFSAGFDAHKDDPLSGTCLREIDYIWATKIVMEACVVINPHAPPPCVSTLEGGYNVAAIAKSALAHIQVLEAGYPKPPPPGDEIAAMGRYMDAMGISN